MREEEGTYKKGEGHVVSKFRLVVEESGLDRRPLGQCPKYPDRIRTNSSTLIPLQTVRTDLYREQTSGSERVG